MSFWENLFAILLSAFRQPNFDLDWSFRYKFPVTISGRPRSWLKACVENYSKQENAFQLNLVVCSVFSDHAYDHPKTTVSFSLETMRQSIFSLSTITYVCVWWHGDVVITLKVIRPQAVIALTS